MHPVQTIRFAAVAACFQAFCLVTPVGAGASDWCALGESLRPNSELFETRRVRIVFDGSQKLGDNSKALFQRVIRKRIWEGKADAVYISEYKDGQCGLLGRRADIVTLVLSNADVSEFRSEQSRNADSPDTGVTVRIAEKAQVQAVSEQVTSGSKSRLNWVRIFFATNRNRTIQPSATEAFGTSTSETISWGSVDVSIPESHEMAHLETPSIWRFQWVPNQNRDVLLAPLVTPLSLAAWRAEVRSRATALNGPGVLLFVHGYNNSFAIGARRAAQLSYDLAFQGPTVYFSWPSDGNLLPYVSDETKAGDSVGAMSVVLQTITSYGPGVPVYVIAHSMGNRVMLHALADLLRRSPDAEHSLRQVVMAAPDVGTVEFKHLITGELAGTSPRYTLYADTHDLPISISGWLHGQSRLGKGGPNIAVFEGVDSIDASTIAQDFFSVNHAYFGDKESLLSDLFTIIHLGSAPSARFRLRPVSAVQGQYWIFSP